MTTPPQPPTGGGVKGAGGKLAAAAGGRRNLLLAAAAGTALVAFVMSRGGGGGGGGSDQQMTGYDSTPYDQYNSLQSQLEDLQKQIEEGKVTPGTTTPTPIPPAPKPPPTTLPWPKPKPKPLPKPKPPLANVPKRFVTIKRGDTLSGIAKKSGISMSALKKLNPTFWTNKKYQNGNRIWSGGKVRVK